MRQPRLMRNIAERLLAELIALFSSSYAGKQYTNLHATIGLSCSHITTESVASAYQLLRTACSTDQRPGQKIPSAVGLAVDQPSR